MALLTATQITKDGITRTLAAVAASDTLMADDRVFIEVSNGSGAGITVTITTPNTVSGLAIADTVVAVANGAVGIIGPISPALYAASTGLATIVCSATTSVTIAAFRL